MQFADKHSLHGIGLKACCIIRWTPAFAWTAPPKVAQLKILGDIREGNIVSISASIVGGMEDASRVQWFKTMSAEGSFDDAFLEAISSSKVAKVFPGSLSVIPL